MPDNIEWATVTDDTDATLYDPGAFSDPFGNENTELAIAFGNGIVLEGTLDAWDAFHDRLGAAIAAERIAEQEAAELDEDDDEGLASDE